jgi:hypothetical protein
MPRLPRLNVPAFSNLARQLRFESPEAARRQLERTEAMALELLEFEGAPDQPAAYPESWIIFRITGLMPDTLPASDAPTSTARTRIRSASKSKTVETASVPLLTRDEILSDLGAFIDRLSSHTRMTKPELARHTGPLGAKWLTVSEVCERWSVSRKTLERWKRAGLVSRRVSTGPGREQAVYAERLLDVFLSRRPATVEHAARFSRIDESTRAKIIEQARVLVVRNNLSLDRCASVLAKKHARSAGAIRHILIAHDRSSNAPIFPDRRRTLSKQNRDSVLEHARSTPNTTANARAVGRTRSTAYRLINDERAAYLRSLELDPPAGPMFEHPDAGQVLLGPALVRTNLARPSPLTLEALERESATMRPVSAATERTLASAHTFLLWRASRAIGALPRSCQGASRQLDAITVDLLWASRLKAELVRLLIPVLFRSLEERLPTASGGWAALVRDDKTKVARTGIDALAFAVDRFDPFKGGRLAAPAIVSLGRAFANVAPAQMQRASMPSPVGGAPRAIKRSASVDLIPAQDWTRSVSPWQAELDDVLPLPGVGIGASSIPGAVESLPPLQRDIVIRRFGYDLSPPRTVMAIASELKRTEATVAAALRRALRTLHRASPSTSTGHSR